MAPDGHLPLVVLAVRLRESFGINPPYIMLWRAATEGRIPALRHGSRWFVLEGDLARIAGILRSDAPTTPTSAASAVKPA
jgi:hypothetical protein